MASMRMPVWGFTVCAVGAANMRCAGIHFAEKEHDMMLNKGNKGFAFVAKPGLIQHGAVLTAAELELLAGLSR